MQVKQNLYEFLKLIPRDKVISYKFLSKIFLKHPRNIAQLLSQNQQQDIYPCYKVVSADGTLWGYNLGVETKKQKLLNDGVIINDDIVDETCIWKPKLYNFFVGFPLEWKSLNKFVEIKEKIQPLFNDITFQDEKTPHLTLRFFGKLDLMDFRKIAYDTLSNLSKLPKDLINQGIELPDFGNFFEKVYYITNNSESVLSSFEDFYKKFNLIQNLPDENRGYKPHLTLFRAWEDFSPNSLEQIQILLSWFDFVINIKKLRFYCAIENTKQIPLIDLDLM